MRRRLEEASVSLEVALTMPVVFVVIVLVLNAAVLARDALAVQGAAREGARVAATGATDAEVAATVRGALGGGLAGVTVRPARRVPGELVTVVVRIRSVAGVEVSGRAAAQVEPAAADP